MLCEDLDEMISTLKAAFDEGKTKLIEDNNKYYLELQFEAMGKSKIHKIEFIKYEPKDPLTELNERITTIQNDIKNLSKEIEEIKQMKNNEIDIKEKMKEILQDKDMQVKLSEIIEQIIGTKFNLTKDKADKNDKVNIEKSDKKKEEKEINEKFRNIEKQLNNKTSDMNEIKSHLEDLGNKYKNLNSQLNDNIKNNELIKNINEKINNNFTANYIDIKVKGSGEIKILQQTKTYKYFFNFERDDIELIVDGENSSLNFERIKDFKNEEKSENCYKARLTEYKLETGFIFYLRFGNKGIHTIRIIFKKKLYDCSYLFYDCGSIVEIDMSNFDCSQVTSCEYMFSGCDSLSKINLGKLDFNLCENFEGMFRGCKELEDLDVSHFNTKNSTTFEAMFEGCEKVKKIDVSKFNSSRCECINSMFRSCKNLSEINMINWDMRRFRIILESKGFIIKNNDYYLEIKGISHLFDGCSKLTIIKMSSNFRKTNPKLTSPNISKIVENKQHIFEGLPQSGKFTWKKGVNCDELLRLLPFSWNRTTE